MAPSSWLCGRFVAGQPSDDVLDWEGQKIICSQPNFETKSSSVFSSKHTYSVAVGREPEATSRQNTQVMVKLADICACVRRLHPDLQARVTPETLKAYRDAMRPFIVHLQNQYDLAVQDPEDLDMLLMGFRTEFELTKSKHVVLVAAVDFFSSSPQRQMANCFYLGKRYGGAPVQNTYMSHYSTSQRMCLLTGSTARI